MLGSIVFGCCHARIWVFCVISYRQFASLSACFGWYRRSFNSFEHDHFSMLHWLSELQICEPVVLCASVCWGRYGIYDLHLSAPVCLRVRDYVMCGSTWSRLNYVGTGSRMICGLFYFCFRSCFKVGADVGLLAIYKCILHSKCSDFGMTISVFVLCIVN